MATERFYIGQKQIIPEEPKSESDKVLNTLANIVVCEVSIDDWETAMEDFGVLQ